MSSLESVFRNFEALVAEPTEELGQELSRTLPELLNRLEAIVTSPLLAARIFICNKFGDRLLQGEVMRNEKTSTHPGQLASGDVAEG